MLMIAVTIISALSIACVAAYFSIIGLATLFSAAFLPVVVMASTLEVGKLVATSWVYQTWEYSPKVIRTMLIGIIGVLMLITSMGIFGLLSKGYLEAKNPASQQNIEIVSLKSDVELVRERIGAIEQEDGFYRLELGDLQAQIDNYPPNYATKRIQTYEAQKPRRQAIASALEENRTHRADQLKILREKNRELNKLEQELVEIEGDLGPIKYVGQLLNVTPDEGVQFVILAIIFAFDPLAVLLVLAANISIKHRYGRGIEELVAENVEKDLQEAYEKSQKFPDDSELPPMRELSKTTGKLKPIKEMELEGEDEEKSPEPAKIETVGEVKRGPHNNVLPSNPNYGRKVLKEKS
jgi:hypothetical protein